MATLGQGTQPHQELDDDHDSAIAYEAPSSTESLRSTIIDYRIENGRTYHRYKDGKYSIPNDERENDRLDMQHHLFLLTFDNRLGFAPPNNSGSKVNRVLDVGTGTGIWAIDFGDEHPEAKVTGIDLSPIQPDFVPPNVDFQIDDLEEEWTFVEKFDYIHSRMMTASVNNWPKFLDAMFSNLNPGGYVELVEINLSAKSDDGSLRGDHAISKWLQVLGQASQKLERPYQNVDELKNLMSTAGFIDIVQRDFRWPSNQWPEDAKLKQTGMWQHENANAGLDAITIAPLTRALGWSKDDVDLLLLDVRKDLKDPHIHAYWPICSICGRKPDI